MARAVNDAAEQVGARGLRAVDEEQRRIDVRNIIDRGHHHVVSPAFLVELPRCLEELEEFPDDQLLVGFGNDADHGTHSTAARASMPANNDAGLEDAWSAQASLMTRSRQSTTYRA